MTSHEETGPRHAVGTVRGRSTDWAAAWWVPVVATLAVGLSATLLLGRHNRLPFSDWWSLAAVTVASYGVVIHLWCVAVAVATEAIGIPIASRFGIERGSPWTVLAASLAPCATDGPLVVLLQPILRGTGWLAPSRLVASAVVFGVALAFFRRVDRRTGSVLAPRTMWQVAGVVLVAGLAGLAAVAWYTERRSRDLGARFEAAVADQQVAGWPVMLIGLDGASWHYLQVLVERGELPALGSLVSRGVAGPLKSMRPSLSAMIWPSITSGMAPSRHGVTDILAYLVPGVDVPLVKMIWPGLGLPVLLDIGVTVGAVRRHPTTSLNCHVPRVWEVVTACGGESAAVGWWSTWPVQNDGGTVVADEFFELATAQRVDALTGAATPPALIPSVYPLAVGPSHVSDVDIRGFWRASDEEIQSMRQDRAETPLARVFLDAYARDLTVERVALELLESDPGWELVALYLRGLDTVSHLGLGYGTPLSERGESVYSGVVTEYYRYADRAVGRLMKAAHPETVFVVVSDHGFEEELPGIFGHTDAPDGVLVAAGGPIVAGANPDGATIFDVFPTVLRLLGLAVPADAQGRVLDELLDPEWSDRHPAETVPSYGLRPIRGVAALPVLETWDEQETLAWLRLLGYIADD